MLIERIARARVDGTDALVDIIVDDGIVVALEPAVGAGGFDAGGRVVVPAFVDAHVHLDKAYLLAEAEAIAPTDADLDSAISAVDALRKEVAPVVVQANAARAVDCLVRHGVIAARVHVEIEPKGALDLVDVHAELAEQVAERCSLQLVAFPQLGLELPGAVDLLRAAMAAGCVVVGGCPYVDDDAEAHLDAVFSLADNVGAAVDLHLDFGDDPSCSHLELVLERTAALGMQGHVTLGHVTTLAALDLPTQQRMFDRMAALDVALVVVPVTDLYLGGHGEPGTRSLAPFDRAAAAGVRVAIGNNNIANPFAPYGNGSIVQAAWLAGITRRVAGADGRRLLLDTISSSPASILGHPVHGPVVGARADLVVLDTDDPGSAVSQAPAVLATINAGRLVCA